MNSATDPELEVTAERVSFRYADREVSFPLSSLQDRRVGLNIVRRNGPGLLRALADVSGTFLLDPPEVANLADKAERAIQTGTRRLQALTRTPGGAIQPGANCALVDYTTFGTAVASFTPGWKPRAFGLFDLGILVTAGVLFDRVYVFHPEVDRAVLEAINRALGEEVFLSADIHYEDADNVLYSRWAWLSQELDNIPPERKGKLEESWARLLNSNRVELNFTIPAALAKVSPSWLGGAPFYQTYEGTKLGSDIQPNFPMSPARINDFASVSTVRTLHNYEASLMTGTTYLPNSARGAVQQDIFDSNEKARPAFDLLMFLARSVVAQRDSRLRDQLEGWKRTGTSRFSRLDVKLPLLLSLALDGLGKFDPDEFWVGIGGLRRMAGRYRKTISRFRERLEDDDPSAYEEARNGILGSAEEFGTGVAHQAVAVALDVVPPVAATFPPAAVVAPAALGAGILLKSPALWSRVHAWLRRPHIHFAAKVSRKVSASTPVRKSAERLWGSLEQPEAESLDRIYKVYPFAI